MYRTAIEKLVIIAYIFIAVQVTLCAGTFWQGECWPKHHGHTQTDCRDSAACNLICIGDGQAGGFCARCRGRQSCCYCHGCTDATAKKGECWPKHRGHSQMDCRDSAACDLICKGDGQDGGYCARCPGGQSCCYCHGCSDTTARKGECWPKHHGHSQTNCRLSFVCGGICKGDGNQGGFCSTCKGSNSCCYCRGCP